MAARVKLRQLPGSYAISRLGAGDGIPGWADGPGFVSMTRTDDELSITCLQDRVPGTVKHDGDWVAFKLQGPCFPHQAEFHGRVFAMGSSGIKPLEL